MARKTNDEFLAEVQALVGNEFTVLEPYAGSQTKIAIRHEKCGTTFSMTPNRFLMGDRCKACSGKTQKTTAQFAAQVNALGNGEYELVGEYVSCHKKVKMRHLVCGSEYDVKPNCFLNGTRCPSCRGSEKLSDMDVQARLDAVSTVGEYRMVGAYSGVTQRISLSHTLCGHQFEASSLQNFLKNKGKCPVCHDSVRDTAWLRRKIQEEGCGEYELVGQYNGFTSKTEVRHLACGRIYPVTPNHFFGMKTRCPHCVRQERESRGVRKIKKYLTDCGIEFRQEVEFESCRLIRPLPFDFSLDKYRILIEFDGEQHFKPKFGDDTLVKQRLRDEIKTTWADKNGYRLIRISYRDESRIPDILSATFND